MTNTSATGGALSPTGAQPAADVSLDVLLQATVAGIIGLPGNLVRPRWQPSPPPQPDQSVDWCAIGVTDILADTNTVNLHHSDGDGSDEVIRHEQITALVSCYGPNAAANASLLRDGLAVDQNRTALGFVGIKYVSSDRIRRVPSLVNQGFINRADINLTFRRKVSRIYPVLNILSSDGVIRTISGDQPFHVEPPA